MIKIYVKKQSNYPVDTPQLKKTLRQFLEKEGIVSDSLVNIWIVGRQKMLEIAEEYLDEEDVIHNVLSFPASETTGDFVYPPEEYLYLGEIIVCYPKAFEEAKEEEKRIDEKVQELVNHGALHLMGKHHD